MMAAAINVARGRSFVQKKKEEEYACSAAFLT